MPELKTIYFARHGQTVYNSEQRLQGWRDSELSELGIEQAGRVAQALKAYGIRRAMVSPLGRAQQTAKIIQAVCDIKLEKNDDLREVSFGEWEGNTLPQIEERWPGQWEARQADKWNYRPPGGEASKDALKRALKIVERVNGWNQDSPLLVVAHFAINRLILSQFGGIDPEDTICMDCPHEVIYRVQWDGNGWTLAYRDLREEAVEFAPGWIRQIQAENQPVKDAASNK